MMYTGIVIHYFDSLRLSAKTNENYRHSEELWQLSANTCLKLAASYIYL
jgi:hypothetical protein